LGDGTTTHKSSPVSVVGGFTNWCQVSAGNYNTAAVRTNGTLWAWGSGSCGRLGDGTTVNKSSPIPTLSVSQTWKCVVAGSGRTFAI
jgi:alpha-tubulin suppressor-like RCC1 family protein